MSFAVKLCLWLLKRADLSLEDRNKLSTAILDSLQALPLRDIISVDETGSLLVNGRSVGIDEARLLREGARTLLNSPTRKVIRDQVAFQAITLGVHKVEKPEQMFFARAAIWWSQNEENLLKVLAGEQETAL